MLSAQCGTRYVEHAHQVATKGQMKHETTDSHHWAVGADGGGGGGGWKGGALGTSGREVSTLVAGTVVLELPTSETITNNI